MKATRNHLCPLCGTRLSPSHFKRHLEKHDREGIYEKATIDCAWLQFVAKLEATR